MKPLNVVICGGGIAAAECLLRLRRLAGPRVAITLVAPHEYLSYRPLTVFVPFGGSPATRYPIGKLAASADAHWVRDHAAWVNLPGRTVHTSNGQSLRYDALLLALGGKERKPNPHTALFSDRDGGQTYRGVVEEIGDGTITSLALIEPTGPCWPLPLYEIALLTAKHARDHGLQPQITLITSYPNPLYPFGADIGVTVGHLLETAGITVHLRTNSSVAEAQLIHLEPAGIDLHPDRIVTLPTITGPNLRGVPGDAHDRFIPVDDRCRVPDTGGRVFAAGDATDLPVKHGSLAAQQADTAAAGIAHLAEAGPAPGPLHPVLRGTFFTGDAPLYLQAHLIAETSWRAELLTEPNWPLDQLVAADELAQYLSLLPG